MAAADYKYWAFISYSHQDKRWGDWLHQALETYRVPKPLIGKDTRRGEPVPARIFPVFRDREELPTSANLGSVIGEALRQSRYLIVICSPQAAASRWVNQEILDFKRLGREDRVLALIVDGEPNAAGGKAGFAPALECFPETMKYALTPGGELDRKHPTEPIAADARADKDGKANAKLKLLAGVLGVNYDDLKRRDEERRRRRQRLVTGVSAALVLVFAALAGAALWQGHQASLQRAAALRTLSRADFFEADRLIANDRRVDALAYLARSLSEDADNDAAALRLTTLLSNRSWLVPALYLPQRRAILSPDGRQLLAIGADHSLQVLDLESGTPLFAPLKPEGVLREAAFSQDGKVLLALSESAPGSADCSLGAWDARNGAPLHKTPLKGCGPVHSAEFSRDGGRLAVVAQSLSGLAIVAGTAKVWDTADGHIVWSSPADSGIVYDAKLSADGRRLISRGRDLRIWDLASGQSVTVNLPADAGANFAALSPDDGKLVTTEENGARIWDARTGQPLTAEMPSGDQTVYAEFSADGKRLVTASAYEENGMAQVWDVESGKPLSPPMEANTEVYAAHFSPDGRRVAVVTGVLTGRWVSYSTVRVWDAASGKPLTEPLSANTPVESAAWSADGRRLLTSADGNVRLWELREGREPYRALPGATEGAVNFSADGRRLLASGPQGLRVRDAASGAALGAPLPNSAKVLSAAFSADGRRIIALEPSSDPQSGRLHIWDAGSARELNPPLTLPFAWSAPLAAVSPNGRRVATISAADPRSIEILDASNGQRRVGPMATGGNVLFAAFGPNGRLLVTASSDKSARIWDAANGEPIGPPLVHSDLVVSAQFSPDGRRLATGTKDSRVWIWDASRGRLLAGPFKMGVFAPTVRFTPAGNRVVGYSSDDVLRFWDAASGKPAVGAIETGGDIYALNFSADGRRLMTAVNDAVQLWDAATGQPSGDALERSGPGAALSPDGTQVLTQSGRLYALAPAARRPRWLPRLANAFAGQVLNQDNALEPNGESFGELRRELRAELGSDDDWAKWGRQFLAENPQAN